MAIEAIGWKDLYGKIEAGERLVLVDALAPMSFAHSHLPGAINLPPERVDESVARKIPDPDVEIVVYCANAECESSGETARGLAALGYTNVRHYAGGKAEWRELGLPLERAGAPFAYERAQ